MEIAIIGMGYVGATTAACLASWGHNILLYDKNIEKVNKYLNGNPEVQETGLHDLISENKDRLQAAKNYGDMLDCDLIFICVDTPNTSIGLNLSNVKAVLDDLYRVVSVSTFKGEIAIRSTVTPELQDYFDCYQNNFQNRIFLNPEFLREGSAIKDFNEPPKVVIGKLKSNPKKLIDLYQHLRCQKFILSFQSVSVTKLIDNSWHALKVAFGNEVGSILASLGLDPRDALGPFLADTKLNISTKYLIPGNAYGGSCLTKDLVGLQQLAEALGLSHELLDGVSNSNNRYITYLTNKIATVAEKEKIENILIGGVAFKSGTNDMRESPNLKIGALLSRMGINNFYIDHEIQISDLPDEQIRVAELLDPEFLKKIRTSNQLINIEFLLATDRKEFLSKLGLEPKIIVQI
jgi:GDP-mannose 6-dehydrogenase